MIYYISRPCKQSPAAFSTLSLPLTLPPSCFCDGEKCTKVEISEKQTGRNSSVFPLLHATLNLTCSRCLWHTHPYIHPSILQRLANYWSELHFSGLVTDMSQIITCIFWKWHNLSLLTCMHIPTHEMSLTGQIYSSVSLFPEWNGLGHWGYLGSAQFTIAISSVLAWHLRVWTSQQEVVKSLFFSSLAVVQSFVFHWWVAHVLLLAKWRRWSDIVVEELMFCVLGS